MQKEIYDFLYHSEDIYWYHCARRNLVEIFLKDMQKELGRKLKILDIGSGTGGMFGVLRKYGEVTGLEFSDYAAGLCQKKHPDITIKIGSANNLSELLPGQSFDLVTFFNVLYHRWIEDDIKVFKEAASIIRPGGYIILNEPAFKCLYRDNDKFSYGIRRYTEKQISGMLFSSGLTLVRSTYFNSISFIPLLILTLLQRLGLMRNKNSSIEAQPLCGFINNLLKGMMLLERICIISFGRVPFGVSVLSIGKKPE